MATGFSYRGDSPRAEAPFAATGDLNLTNPATTRATGRLPLVVFNYTRIGGTRAVTAACMAEARYSALTLRTGLQARMAVAKRKHQLRKHQQQQAAAAAVAAAVSGGEGSSSGEQGQGGDTAAPAGVDSSADPGGGAAVGGADAARRRLAGDARREITAGRKSSPGGGGGGSAVQEQ